MKLKYIGTSAIVVLLKEPEFYCLSLQPNEVIEANDNLGTAIASRYSPLFAHVLDEPKRQKQTVAKTEVKA